jgi:hypothetical protein
MFRSRHGVDTIASSGADITGSARYLYIRIMVRSRGTDLWETHVSPVLDGSVVSMIVV